MRKTDIKMLRDFIYGSHTNEAFPHIESDRRMKWKGKL